MILPSAALALVMSSRYIRQIRAAALDELQKDYIVGLRARGISERTILFRNVLKNIMVIVITLTGISVGSLLGGTVIIETIFNWPGIGSLIMTAISNRDYPVIQAVVVWMALAFFLVNLLADLSYRYFNPKIKEL
jgi:nickel ABC superfamily ATP binding cassette transporter, permease protein